MVRSLSLFALVLATTTVFGCASLPAAGPLVLDEPPTVVRVENRGATRLVVYAELGGSQQRLGSVLGGSYADLEVPARFLARGDGRLVAYGNGSEPNFVSDPLVRSFSGQLHWLVAHGSRAVLTSRFPQAARS
jgi:hypothetical protein